jgi:23S rRNA G2069 N7-methylase RlmK/C1962 C5-methylase RlmI
VTADAWEILFRKAMAWRLEREQRLRNQDEIGRLFAGHSDGGNGVIVDAFGPLVVLTIYNLQLVSSALEILKGLRRSFGSDERFFIAKVRSQQGGFEFIDPDRVLGRHWIAREDNCLFEVRADDKNDFGLFPDARPARLALRTLIQPDSRLLNLFSYTCGFSIVACKQGVHSAVNVDASSEMLTWGKRNAALNQVDFAVVPEMVQKYLARLLRRVGEGKIVAPDVWICDPPAFGVGRGQTRVLKHFWGDFWHAVNVLKPRALLVLRNDRVGHRFDDQLALAVEANVGAGYEVQPVDFAPSPSLCYEGKDGFYKLNESLILLKR